MLIRIELEIRLTEEVLQKCSKIIQYSGVIWNKNLFLHYYWSRINGHIWRCKRDVAAKVIDKWS